MEHLLDNKRFHEQSENEIYFEYSKYAKYFTALKNDNVELCQEIFDNAGQPNKLINGKFRFGRKNKSDKGKDVALLCHPLSLAAVYGSCNVVTWLLESGAKPEKVREKNVGNILHCIAQFHTLDLADSDFNIIVQLDTTMTVETMNELMTDDREKHGLRPVEMAFRFGAYKLGRQMMDLGNVYLTECIQRGLVRRCRYDMTIYDHGNHNIISRENKSPIQFIRYIPSSYIPSLMASGLLDDPLMLKWTCQRVWRIRFYAFTILWLILRNLSCPLFLFTAGELVELAEEWDNMSRMFLMKVNRSSSLNSTINKELLVTTYNIEQQIIIFYFILTLIQRALSIFERIDFHLRRKKIVSLLMPSKSFGKETILITGAFYRLTRFLSDWIAVSVYIQIIWNIQLQTDIHSLRSYISIWLVFFAVSNLYYVEVLCPYYIGRHVILLRVTVAAFLTVSFIFFYWIYFFSELFAVCLKEQYPQEFNNTISGMYSTTLIFLNTLEFKGWEDTNLMLVHLLFIMIIGVCLLNTMTALMTDRMTEISNQLEVYYKIQRLDAMMKIEALCSLSRKAYRFLTACCHQKNELIIWVQTIESTFYDKRIMH